MISLLHVVICQDVEIVVVGSGVFSPYHMDTALQQGFERK